MREPRLPCGRERAREGPAHAVHCPSVDVAPAGEASVGAQVVAVQRAEGMGGGQPGVGLPPPLQGSLPALNWPAAHFLHTCKGREREKDEDFVS